MAYQIIATVQLEAEDETALGTIINQVKTFVDGKNGEHKFIIRTKEEVASLPTE